MTKSVNVGETTGEIIEFMMSRLPSELEGISFIETSFVDKQFTELHEEMAIMKTVLIMRKIMPAEMAKVKIEE